MAGITMLFRPVFLYKLLNTNPPHLIFEKVEKKNKIAHRFLYFYFSARTLRYSFRPKKDFV